MRKLFSVFICLIVIAVAGIGADGPLSDPEDECIELPSPCRQFCREAHSWESRALLLDAAAAEAERIAGEERRKAEDYEDLLQQLTFQEEKPKKDASRRGKPQNEKLWKAADSLIRLLVPRDTRNRNRRYKKTITREPSRHTANMPNGKEVDVICILEKAGKARLRSEKASRKARAIRNDASSARTKAYEKRCQCDASICN